MALHRAFGRRVRQRRRLPAVSWISSSAPLVVPFVLVIVTALMGWLLYGRVSPTVDNTGTTTPVAQPDLPQTTNGPAGSPRASP